MTKTFLIKMDVENAFRYREYDLIDIGCHPIIDFLYFYCHFKGDYYSM